MRIFISTSIPYVNASPHVGHALELVQADAYARMARVNGDDVFFLSGTDENAIKNIEAAAKMNIPVQEFVDRHAQKFEGLKDSMNLSFDKFIRTSSATHKKGAQKLWNLCSKDIYKKTYTGFYCVGCETFYDNPKCEDDSCSRYNQTLPEVSETNYFFALSKYTERIKELLIRKKLRIHPEFRTKELLAMLEKGIPDISVSRPVERTGGWGVPVPDDANQMMYVWFDALSNYITGLGFGTLNEEMYNAYWEQSDKRIHYVGKNITKFHCIYWPAMLLSAGLSLPTDIVAHGFIMSGGVKMSKSIGNVANPHDEVAKYGTDAVRYYLLREIPTLDDGDYTERRMKEIYNSELANELGNLVSRVCALARKDGHTATQQTVASIDFSASLQGYVFTSLITHAMQQVKDLNKYLNEHAIWKLEVLDRAPHLTHLIAGIRSVAHLLHPVMPHTSAQVIHILDHIDTPMQPLFPRLA